MPGIPRLRALLATTAIATSGIAAQARPDTLVVTAPAAHASGWFGLALDCSGCTAMRDGTPARGRPAVVTGVLRGGPAARANLVPGDTILAVDGHPVSAQEMRARLGSASANQVLRLTVGRGSGRTRIDLVAASVPVQRLGGDSMALRFRGTFDGMQVEALGPATPIVSIDTAGRVMYVRVGDNVIRLSRPRS